MTRDEVARYLRLTPSTVSRFVNDGSLRVRRIATAPDVPARERWEFDQQDVDDFIESCRIQPQAVSTPRKNEKAGGCGVADHPADCLCDVKLSGASAHQA